MNDASRGIAAAKANVVSAIDVVRAWLTRACRLMEFYRSLLPTIANKPNGENDRMWHFDVTLLNAIAKGADISVDMAWDAKGDLMECLGLLEDAQLQALGDVDEAQADALNYGADAATLEAKSILDDCVEYLFEADLKTDTLRHFEGFDAQGILAVSGVILDCMHCAEDAAKRARELLSVA